MDKSTVSIVLSVLNESQKIENCLKSVGWADEIIVIDNGSTDNTISIVKKFTDKIFSKVNNPMLNVNKNYGFTKSRCDWILCLDGDEEITPQLSIEIQEKVKNSGDINGYWISRKNIIFGKWIEHGIWWPDRQLRLFRRGKGIYPCRHVHEYLEVSGKTGILINPYLHHNYESISQYISKMDRIYTENEVTNLLATDYQLSWYDAIRFPVSDFVKIYFAQRGFLDGLHGLVLSLLQAFYSFLVFTKLWEKKGFSEKDISLKEIKLEFQKSASEIYYWYMTSQISQSKNPITQLVLKLKRKLR
jgi:glycosyltransferase involved in cell wall biosynthesis